MENVVKKRRYQEIWDRVIIRAKAGDMRPIIFVLLDVQISGLGGLGKHIIKRKI